MVVAAQSQAELPLQSWTEQELGAADPGDWIAGLTFPQLGLDL